MLDDMDVLVPERRIEKAWEMPQRERRVPQCLSDQWLPERKLDPAERPAINHSACETWRDTEQQ